MNITVPTPEAYTVHKVIINGSRGKKSEKDMNAVQHILPYLDCDKINIVLESLTKKLPRDVLEKTIEYKKDYERRAKQYEV